MMTQEQIDNERNLVALELWGSTSGMLTKWEGKTEDGEDFSYAACKDIYAPDWLSESDLGCERDECVTVVHQSYFSAPRVPAGYRIADQYNQPEKECPWCNPSYVEGCEPESPYLAGDKTKPECPLCEGSDRGYIYFGDDCSVVVFAPRYSYGSGMVGCLYDNGPHRATSVEDAIESLKSTFDELNDLTWERVAKDLREQGIHYFDRRLWPFVGADYCEISDLA